MKEKIEWYREVLALEPNSKVFFPLAKMLAGEGEIREAIKVLETGLERHSEYLEARLFLIELLYQTNQKEACARQVNELSAMFASYAGFWQAWAACLSQEPEEEDTASILRFLAANFISGPLKLHDVLNRGLAAIIEEKRTGATLVISDTPETQHVSDDAAGTTSEPVIAEENNEEDAKATFEAEPIATTLVENNGMQEESGVAPEAELTEVPVVSLTASDAEGVAKGALASFTEEDEAQEFMDASLDESTAFEEADEQAPDAVNVTEEPAVSEELAEEDISNGAETITQEANPEASAIDGDELIVAEESAELSAVEDMDIPEPTGIDETVVMQDEETGTPEQLISLEDNVAGILADALKEETLVDIVSEEPLDDLEIPEVPDYQDDLADSFSNSGYMTEKVESGEEAFESLIDTIADQSLELSSSNSQEAQDGELDAENSMEQVQTENLAPEEEAELDEIFNEPGPEKPPFDSEELKAEILKMQENEQSTDINGLTGEDENISLRTRSMAEVLAEQGDIQGALDIYQELHAAATDAHEIDDIKGRIATLKMKMRDDGAKGEPQQDNKKLINLLESLAQRVEARVLN